MRIGYWLILLLGLAAAAAALALALRSGSPSSVPAFGELSDAGARAPTELGEPAPSAARAERASAAPALAGSELRAQARELRGLCVSDASTPVEGAHVAIAGPPGWSLLVATQSDAAGRFRLDLSALEPADDKGRFLACSAPGFQNQAHPLREWLAAHPDPEPQLVLVRGVRGFGRVLDRSGMPIEGARVAIIGSYGDETRTNARGAFAFASGIPAGRHRLQIHAVGYFAREFSWELPFAGDEPSFVLQSRRRIRGTVSDSTGAPLEGVRVYTAPPRPAVSEPSGADGSFEIEESELAPEAAHLTVETKRFVPWRSEHPIAWGATDVQVRLRACPELVVHVREEDGGAAVETFRLYVMRPNEGPSPQSLRAEGAHPGGTARVGVPEHGIVHVLVAPAAYLAPSARLPVEIAGAETLLEVELVKKKSLRVLVRDEAGAPLADAATLLLCVTSDQRPDRWRAATSDREGLGRPSMGEQRILAAARSDASGLAELWLPPDRRGAAVQVRCAGFAPAWREGSFGVGEELRIAMQRGGTVRFSLTPKSLAKLRPEGWLVPPDQRIEDARRGGEPRAPWKGDGVLEFADVPAGRWQLALRLGLARVAPPEGAFELVAGQEIERAIDLSAYAPAELRANVAWSDGAIHEEAVLEIQSLDESRMDPAALEILDTEGRRSPFRISAAQARTVHVRAVGGELGPVALAPGSYELSLRLQRPSTLPKNGFSEDACFYVGTRHFGAGESVRLELVIPRQKLVLRLRTPRALHEDETPHVTLVEANAKAHASSSAAGLAIFEPAPTRPFHVEVNGRRYPATGDFTPRPGLAEWEQEIDLR